MKTYDKLNTAVTPVFWQMKTDSFPTFNFTITSIHNKIIRKKWKKKQQNNKRHKEMIMNDDMKFL